VRISFKKMADTKQTKMKAILISENGERKEVIPENKIYFTLEEMQKMVCGYVQVVPLNEKFCLVINEEGKINGECKQNDEATKEWIKVYGDTDILFGNVLMCPVEFIN